MSEGKTVEQFEDMWRRLTPTQRRFAVAMTEYPTKKEAAEAINISPQTAYNWNGAINEVVDFMINDIALSTLGILRANASKAAIIKSQGLDSDNEKIRQDVATEILDRNLGKATNRTEVTGADGGAIIINWDNDNDTD